MLLEASSEAPATWLDRLWVVSAVRVSVPAAASSCTADDETLETMAPTASSNSSAKRISSARRAALAALFCASWVAASRSARATACTLNSSTALAISPSSSLRPRPGSTTSKLPAASSRIALHIAVIGREMPLPRKKAQTQPSRKPPAARIRISRSVSPMVGVRFGFEPLLIGQQVRLHRPRALVDGGGRFRHFQRQLVDLLGIIDQLGERLLVFFQENRDLLDPLTNFVIVRRNRL